jgi:hypothetical protein
MIVFLQREIVDAVDGLGYFDLLLQREFNGVLRKLEIGCRRFNRRDDHAGSRIEDEPHETVGVSPFLRRLFVKMPGESRQGLQVKVSTDGVVLEGGGKFHSNLTVDRIDDLLRNEHALDISRNTRHCKSTFRKLANDRDGQQQLLSLSGDAGRSP